MSAGGDNRWRNNLKIAEYRPGRLKRQFHSVERVSGFASGKFKRFTVRCLLLVTGSP